MTVEDLQRYIKLGKYPPVVYCEKKYDGICCVIRITKGNKVFFDYTAAYDNADSEGDFRATFIYDSFEQMIKAIEKFTQKDLSELPLNPYCYELFNCDSLNWKEFEWDLYNGKIQMLSDYKTFSIGSFFWNGLYKKAIKPDCSEKELANWTKQNR